MSDFNPLDRAKIPTHRSSFDLSSKKLFTAKVGEILPCYWQIAIPDTKYRISSDWFTRTVPVNTAAYTRIKEYYDFYADKERNEQYENKKVSLSKPSTAARREAIRNGFTHVMWYNK